MGQPMSEQRMNRLSEDPMTRSNWLVMGGLVALALVGAVVVGGPVPLYGIVIAIAGVATFSIVRAFFSRRA